MSPTPQETPSPEQSALERSRMAQWSSLLALAVSALALAVGTYQTVLMQSQTRLMQAQARASVWPRVDIGFDYSDGGDSPGFALHVENNGVGPALVKSVLLSFDGKPVRHWKDILAQLISADEKAHVDMVNLGNIVLPPGTDRDTQLTAIRVTTPGLAKNLYEARDRIALDICYCSVYEDCWITSMTTDQPRSTPACAKSDHEFSY